MPHLSQSRSVLSLREGLRARINSYLIILLFSLLSCLVMNAQTSPVTNQTKQDGSEVAAPQGRSDARTLEPGKPFEREIKPGETHSYLLRCDAGQFTQINVEQRQGNVGLALFGVDGHPILSLDNNEDTEGNKRLPVLADVSGIYRVEVKALGRSLQTARYDIDVAQPPRSKTETTQPPRCS